MKRNVIIKNMNYIQQKVRYFLILIDTLVLVHNKIEVIYIKYRKQNRRRLIKLKNGLDIYISDPECLWVLWEVFSSLDYDIDLNEAKVVVDIGAHIGLTSLFFKLKYPESKIYSYEPNSSSYNLLNKNIRINKIKNIKTYRLAVTNKTNEIIMLHRLENSGTSYLVDEMRKTDTKNGTFKKVKTISIEDLLEENNISYLDLLKIDCEGKEYDILLDLKRKVYKKIGCFVIEYHYHPKYGHGDLIRKLKQNGFRVKVKKSQYVNDTGLVYARKNK